MDKEILKIYFKNLFLSFKSYFLAKLVSTKNIHSLTPVLSVSNQHDFTNAFSDIEFLKSISSEKTKTLPKPVSKIKGFCVSCERNVNFLVDMTSGGEKIKDRWLPNWRERLECPICKMNNRQRLMTALIKPLMINPNIKNIYFMEQVTPIFNYFKNLFSAKNIIGSEYLGHDYKSGYLYGPIRHEDVENLSFKDASIDLIVSNDVFEHVPNPKIAFTECFRVLRKKGIMLFTIPFHSNKSKSVTRATLNNGALIAILPKVFHGNPVSANGSLVFTDFGWDILNLFKKIGFKSVNLEVYYSVKFGHLGNGQLLFRAIK